MCVFGTHEKRHTARSLHSVGPNRTYAFLFCGIFIKNNNIRFRIQFHCRLDGRYTRVSRSCCLYNNFPLYISKPMQSVRCALFIFIRDLKYYVKNAMKFEKGDSFDRLSLCFATSHLWLKPLRLLIICRRNQLRIYIKLQICSRLSFFFDGWMNGWILVFLLCWFVRCHLNILT